MNNSIIPFYTTTDKYITRSKGCYQYDSDGKQYIDFESGVWCANLGHSDDRINMVIEQQIRENIHHGYKFRNELSENLAERLNEKLGLIGGQSVFLLSGSEAVNLSITLARHLTKREKILKINNSFLSSYGFGLIARDNTVAIDIPFNDFESIEKIDFSKIAAFVLETGGASIDMVQFPDKDFVLQIVQSAREKGCIIIVDEVTTGFGRLGEWFGYSFYDMEPDIVATGKALGNGYPISAVSIHPAIVTSLSNSPINYAQSHINDPLGCAIGLEVIKIIDETDLIAKGREVGTFFHEQLSFLKNTYSDKIKDVRARGLMLALEFSEATDGASISRQLFENGFVTGFKKNVLRFLPPLIIEKKDIVKFTSKLEEIITSV